MSCSTSSGRNSCLVDIVQGNIMLGCGQKYHASFGSDRDKIVDYLNGAAQSDKVESLAKCIKLLGDG